MISRHARVQDKRATRKGILLIILSLVILTGVFFYGMPTLARFSGIIFDLKGSALPIAENDMTPPGPPQFTPQPPASSKETEISLTIRSEAGSLIKLFQNDNLVKEITVDDSSKFTYLFDLLPGSNTIWATATDTAGNESIKSSVWEIVYDQTAPVLEISEPIEGQAFSGSEKSITVSGQTEKDVKVTVNERIVIVGAEGKFSQKIDLKEGENIISILAVDKGENETKKEIRVTYLP